MDMTHPDILRVERTGYPCVIPNDNSVIGWCKNCGKKIYDDYSGDALVTDSGDMFCNNECCFEFYGIRKVDN